MRSNMFNNDNESSAALAHHLVDVNGRNDYECRQGCDCDRGYTADSTDNDDVARGDIALRRQHGVSTSDCSSSYVYLMSKMNACLRHVTSTTRKWAILFFVMQMVCVHTCMY